MPCDACEAGWGTDDWCEVMKSWCCPYMCCAVLCSLLLLRTTSDFGRHESLCWKGDSSRGFLAVQNEASWERFTPYFGMNSRVAEEMFRAGV